MERRTRKRAKNCVECMKQPTAQEQGRILHGVNLIYDSFPKPIPVRKFCEVNEIAVDCDYVKLWLVSLFALVCLLVGCFRLVNRLDTHRWPQSHTVLSKWWKWSPTIFRCITHMCYIGTACILSSIDSDWYFTRCWAQFLI